MRKWVRSKAGILLSFTLVCGMIFPCLPPGKVLADTRAAEDTGVVEAWGEGWHHLCIDGFGYAPNGVCSNGDRYASVPTDEALNSEERKILFWALLSYMGSEGDSEAVKVISAVNQGAESAGLRRIGKAVTMEDLKAVLHSASVRSRYDWLDFAVSHEKDYMRLSGLLGGGWTYGGKTVPAILQNAVSLSSAAQGTAIEGGFVLEFDPSGKDGDFIEKVPLKLSLDGTNWQDGNINGWNVEKSRTEIRLTNPNPQAGPLYLKFDPTGTEYASSSGGYGSADECYIQSIQVVKCIQCCGTHFAGGKLHPLEEHQRNVTMEIRQVPVAYYAALGGKTGEWGSPEGEVHFQIYRHEEDMEADYLVQLYKYDYETGRPLEGVSLDLYERFDDKEAVNRDRDGRGQIYEGGEPYLGGVTHSPVLWDGFRLVTSLRTDAEGHAQYKSEKTYHYEKTFCDGHPAPLFAEVPEAEVNEETGEADNQSEIDEAMAMNGELAIRWLSCVAECERKAEGSLEGVHFHWIMEEVDQDAIRETAESGDYVDAGATESADADTAFENSGCKEDCRDTYEKFISMKYSYTFVETMAREGYILHGLHRDDVPVEVITTDSSQNGANAVFGGEYSETIGRRYLPGTARSDYSGEEESFEEAEKAETEATYYTEEIRSLKTAEPIEASDRIRYQPVPFLEEEQAETASVSDGRRIHEIEETVLYESVFGTATSSDGQRKGLSKNLKRMGDYKEQDDTRMFEQAYEEALSSAGEGEEVTKGPSDRYSHSSGRDGEEEAFRIYDHRTEGEIHIRKRDMELPEGETQGDGTLEGAVYGLFAAEDLIHPDGTTGVVFRQNDLVAVAATDKEGDASFLAITEAPGHTYDYESGMIVETEEGWSQRSPKNLYTGDLEIDDYREDHAFVRKYADFQSINGNCWIGCPLFLGHYYVKELSRSEGYELSVNGRNHKISNYGYSLEVTIPRGKGSVAVTRAPYVEPQSSGQEEDTMPNVIHFVVSSQETGENGYDMVFDSFPKGTRLYRKSVSREESRYMAGTGKMEKKYLFDQSGQPVYERAEADNTYIKLNPDGSFMTKETAVSKVVASMGSAPVQDLDGEIIGEILDGDLGEDRVKNQRDLVLDGVEGEQFLYLKRKTEKALRANGYGTPSKTEEGIRRYSDESEGIYDRGVRAGQTDKDGVSGVDPGEAAAETVYGSPVIDVEINKVRDDGTNVTMGDAILSLLDFYGQHPWYRFGGIDGYEETAKGWRFSLYAGVSGNPENYVILGENEEENRICHRLPWNPSDSEKSPRWVYAVYSNQPDPDAFGTFEDFRSWQIFGMYRCSAVLVSDGVVEDDGTLRSKTVKQNVYYEKGEILRDVAGNPLQAYEWEEVQEPVTQEKEVYAWTEILLEEKDGKLISHGTGEYTDEYGVLQSDRESGRETVYKAVLPRTTVTLTKDDIERFPAGSGYEAGETIGAGDYVLKALGGKVFVYLDYETQTMAGDSLYVKPVSLTYPGQESCFQDGDQRPGEGTQKNPVKVEERVISQFVKIVKSVENDQGQKEGIDNFRFKIYLKSNLQRLYRDEEGNIVWVDRKGEETNPKKVKEALPALAVKFYTKVPHKTDPLYKNHLDSVIANDILYDQKDGLISDSPGSGYTRILEIRQELTGDGEPVYNYEKFFDAISVANQDHWKDKSVSHTSHRPLGNRKNRCEEAKENVKASDNVRQFAINWYLDSEVKKLVRTAEEEAEGEMTYSDELYDKALREAIVKSENYLKPFFRWNLDQIYAIEWDSEAGGGKDRDFTTLSADKEEGNQYSGTGVSLPYGTYVVAEQQPMYASLEDLKNRHYRIDGPKEVLVPSVYESYDQAYGDRETLSHYYEYHREEKPESLTAKYGIRFQEEDHVIKAHNRFGDFEIYKYGMEIGQAVNEIPGGEEMNMPQEGDYFALSQSLYRPYLDYYNPEDDRTGGEVSYYLTEGMSGREGVSAIYRYSSVSEHGEEKTMTGSLVAVDGKYAHALVPWTMAVPEREGIDMEPDETGESSYQGLAYKLFTNTPYKTRLRIEKLDSETHENILHEGAIFRIYTARRDEALDGEGKVKTYDEDTLVAGSREFLEGLGAVNITKAARGSLPAGLLYTGFVPAGTPVCREEDQVILTDSQGNKTGDFKAFTTTRDGLLKNPDGDGFRVGDQNAGYLETPEALPAGVYVLVEIGPPSGYTRTKPVAVEIYSDQTAYYQEGSPASRVLAAVYDRFRDAREELARIYVENAPVKVRIEKKKKVRDQITYKIHGTLEFLNEMKAAGEQVEIVFYKGEFAGYGYVTRQVERPEGENPYVAGAQMTLYQGIKLKPSGDREDYGFEGLVVERNFTGKVTRMYVKEGFAGTSVEFCQETEEDGGIHWNGVTTERPDTDILYYDLGDLDLFTTRVIDGRKVIFGYDENHNLVNLEQLEDERRNILRTDREHSVYGFKGGILCLELSGGDFTEMSYNAMDRILTVPEDTAVYHLDRDGCRESWVDPYTGMAYVPEEGSGNRYVWPVHITKDEQGRVLAVDKIATSRVGTIGENQEEMSAEDGQEEGYLTGSWRTEKTEGSHKMYSTVKNVFGGDQDGEEIFHGNEGEFEKYMEPVLDLHGLPVYYRNSSQVYEEKISLYDRDGDPTRTKTSDLQSDFDQASYGIGGRDENARMIHRLGEHYLLENTWVTGEKTPNDPFDRSMTEGQADLLKRIPAGIYIMEEIKAPSGYVKAVPIGLTVKETSQIQTAEMEDDRIKVLFRKLDGDADDEYQILDMGLREASGAYRVIGKAAEGTGKFLYGQVTGAKLVLLNEKGQKILEWTTKEEPLYIQELEAGTYILKEDETPEGFVKPGSKIIEVKSVDRVQIMDVYNDHTKVEIEKYRFDGSETMPVNGALFALYEAETDEKGEVRYEDGSPVYNREKLIDTWESSDGTVMKGFAQAFEEMYQEYGTGGRQIRWTVEGKSYEAQYVSHRQIDGESEETIFPAQAEMLFAADEGKQVRIMVLRDSAKGQSRNVYEYQFNYKKLTKSSRSGISYDTLEGIHRLDYLPAERSYVLVEVRPPEGYKKAPDRVIKVENTGQIQRHRILNQESRILISKCVGEKDSQGKESIRELPGACLVLYRAGDNGELIQDQDHIAAQWISGSDGVYTEKEWINGQIPEGYEVGDLRPHQLTRLPDGIYYLAETESPDYYTLMEPVKIVLGQQEQIKIFRVRNDPVKGQLEILKKDREGKPLDGALFQLAAYREGNLREPVFIRNLSSTDGRILVRDLPVGEGDADGRIIPYEYRLKEVTPPEGYGADSRIHRFQFSPDREGLSYESGQKAEMKLELINDKTRVAIGKKDFDNPDHWVRGAEMAVFLVIGRGEEGEYLCQEEPVFTWVTDREEFHILEGLTAGQTYLLTELKAPDGYEGMEPIAFTLSADGRKISSITPKAGVITVHTYEESDVIRSVEVRGRYGVKVEMKLEDQEGQRVALWTAGGDGHVLRETDGIGDGAVYCLTETTVYSDGSREITGQTTRRAHLSEEGEWEIPDRAIEKVHLELSHEDGAVIRGWNPSEMIPVMEADNPVTPESPRIVIGNQQEISREQTGGGVGAEDPVWVTIRCTNMSHHQADMSLTVSPGKESAVIDPGDGILENGRIQYVLKQMEPGESRRVSYVCQLEETAKEVSVSAVCKCMGVETKSEKTVPVLQKNRLTVFYQVTGTGKDSEPDSEREFKVFLYTADGEELKGRYEYEGSRRGSLKSGDTLRLSANEYVVIDPGNIYRDIRYEVKCTSKEDIQAVNETGQAWASSGACAVFSREAEDPLKTAVFKKASSYQLLETTYYSDGSVRESGKIRFLLGDRVSIEGMGAVDRRQKAAISKLELTGHKELEGARMQVLKEDRTVVEEWISTKEPHILEAVLVPGETYILHEEAAPMGYSYAEEIWFQVTEGEFVTQVVMEDQGTKAVFSKKTLTGEEELPGAAMEVRDKDGNVIEQWISGVEPYEIREKLEAGETYFLHEEGAPDGYAYAEDVAFTVSLDGRTDKVEMRDAPTRVEISKTDITGSLELPGAVLRVVDREGNVIEEWISKEEPHNITGKLKAGETYLLREESAPDGWAYAEDVEFQVSTDGRVDRVVMRDERTQVEIQKIDQKTGLALEGAELELLTKELEVIETWISAGTPHRIEGKLKAGETYILREKRAPSGYRILNQDVMITVPRKVELLTITLENGRRPTTPKVPQKPDEKKTGKVYGHYESIMTAHGRHAWQTFTNLSLPKLGDEGRSPWKWPIEWNQESGILAVLGSLLGLLIVFVLAGRRKNVEKAAAGIGLFLLLGLGMALSVHAETVEVKSEGQIVVTGEICTEEEGPPPRLPEIYRYKDVDYRQQSCQLVTGMTEGGTKEVEEEIVYQEVEQTDSIPETAWITVTDPRYQTEQVREFPIIDAEFYNWRWVDGFTFPLTVEDADADVYELAGIQVPAREERPFEGYEDQVLSLVPVNPDYYRITEVKWDGQPWTGEDHKIYRQAQAIGEKYVADCRALYGGTAVLEPKEGLAWQGVYQQAEKESETEAETESSQQLVTEPETEIETGTEDKEPENQMGKLRWYQTLAGELVISVGILFLILLIGPVVIRKRQKEKKSFKK